MNSDQIAWKDRVKDTVPFSSEDIFPCLLLRVYE